MVLALRPDLVYREQIENDPPKEDPVLRGFYTAEDMKQKTDHGAVGYPELASAEKGRKFLEAAVKRSVEVIEAMLRRELPG
jgi:creatinine amidohydrolase/Fe(II)-dependent formamide hydrolase-like protein